MQRKEREFAIENHNLVYDFLIKNNLPESAYYDIVIFGYLRAVQEYCDRPSLHKHRFSTIAWKQMRRSLSNHFRYLSRPKRNSPTVSFDDMTGSVEGQRWADVIPGQDTLMRELETELLLHALADALPPREMQIIYMKVRGDRMHDIAKEVHLTFHQINGLLDDAYPTILSVLRG